MNNNTNEQTTTSGNGQNATPVRDYRPNLTLYHANSKGSGSAVRFEVVPATGSRDGAIYMTLAQQMSTASGSREQGNRQHARFDWQNRVTVKLNFSDLCQMIPVFKGASPNVGEGKGLYHDSRSHVTMIKLAFQKEPTPGYFLEVSRRAKAGPEPAARIWIVFNAAEAYGLGAVLEQALGYIAFGIPQKPRSGMMPPPSAPEDDPAEDDAQEG
ncbi:MAG: hypothetical protein ACOX9C_03135 [Kiritimatiellia bacterium]|jgi:hypothetical protein